MRRDEIINKHTNQLLTVVSLEEHKTEVNIIVMTSVFDTRLQ